MLTSFLGLIGKIKNNYKIKGCPVSYRSTTERISTYSSSPGK